MEVFISITAVFFVALIIIALIAFFKRNHNIILICYLIAAFKTNLLDEANIIFLEPQYIIGLIWLISIRYDALIFKKTNSKLYSYIITFLIVLLTFEILGNLKLTFLFKTHDLYSIKTIVKRLIELLVVITLIKYRYQVRIKQKSLVFGIVIGSLFIGIQSFISYKYGYIGKMGLEIEEGLRISGLMKNDLNELTVIINISLLFILQLFLQRQISYYYAIPIIVILFIAILLTGSRSGLIGTGLVIGIFIFNLMSINRGIHFWVLNFLILSVLVSIGYFTTKNFGSTTLNRLHSEQLDENVRVLRWHEYKDFFQKNPSYLLTGAMTEITGRKSFRRAAHNFYLQNIYHYGIFYLALLLYLLFKISSKSHPFVKYYILLFLYYGLTLSNPPLGYLPYIVLFFNLFYVELAQIRKSQSMEMKSQPV